MRRNNPNDDGHFRMVRQHQTSDAQTRIGESRNSQMYVHIKVAAEPVIGPAQAGPVGIAPE